MEDNKKDLDDQSALIAAKISNDVTDAIQRMKAAKTVLESNAEKAMEAYSKTVDCQELIFDLVKDETNFMLKTRYDETPELFENLFK